VDEAKRFRDKAIAKPEAPHPFFASDVKYYPHHGHNHHHHHPLRPPLKKNLSHLYPASQGKVCSNHGQILPRVIFDQ
jgi:hypothetical protein